MPLNPFRACGGFTLVETLVAMTIAATAAVFLAHLVALGTRQTTASRDTLESLIAAQRKLEELRAITWSYSVPGSDLAISPASTLFSDTMGFVDRGPRFITRWAVQRRDPGDADVVVMRVCVFDAVAATAQPEACVSTIRTKRP